MVAVELPSAGVPAAPALVHGCREGKTADSTLPAAFAAGRAEVSDLHVRPAAVWAAKSWLRRQPRAGCPVQWQRAGLRAGLRAGQGRRAAGDMPPHSVQASLQRIIADHAGSPNAASWCLPRATVLLTNRQG